MDHNTPQAEVNEAFSALRAFDRQLAQTVNKNDRVHALISACITEGMNTRLRIVRALERIGHAKPHVVICLRNGTRLNPEAPYWGVDGNGIYYLPSDALPSV